jgi:hypothetical protein
MERFPRSVAPASWIPMRTHDQRGGVHAHERATEASEARMAKRSERAVSEGPDGLSERQRVGVGTLERLSPVPSVLVSNAYHH